MTKLIYGVGCNSGGKHKASKNNKVTKAYHAWYDMIGRCYCPKLQSKNPSYKGCSVTTDWHDFQDFAEWYYGHEYSDMGYDLDKDLLYPKNKIYSPTTCCFAPKALNVLLIDRKSTRGEYPQGIYFSKDRGKYQAQISINGKQKNLGRFDCQHEAYRTYKIAKEAYVKVMAIEWQGRISDDLFTALMNWQLER
jgi:hypothetical protein